MKTFSIKQSFKKAYKSLMERKALYFGATLVAGLIVIVLGEMSDSHTTVVNTLGSIALVVFQFIITAGATQFILKDFRKENVTYNDFLPTNSVLKRYIKALLKLFVKLLPFILVAIASVLLVLSGVFGTTNFVVTIVSTFGIGVATILIIYYIIKYYFFSYISIEKSISAKEVMTEAEMMSNGNRLKLLLVMIIVGMLNFVGGITFIGWIFTAPISMLMVAHIYMALKGENVAMAEETPKAEEVIAPISPAETEQVESAS